MDNYVRKQTILIVDDVAENVELLASILSPEYHVITARGGSEALKIVEQSCVPDLILLDILMPEMDGYEVCRKLKQNPLTKQIPVIFATALDENIEIAKAFQIGGVDYLTKPINSVIALARIRTHVALASAMQNMEMRNALQTRYVASLCQIWEIFTQLGRFDGPEEAFTKLSKKCLAEIMENLGKQVPGVSLISLHKWGQKENHTVTLTPPILAGTFKSQPEYLEYLKTEANHQPVPLGEGITGWLFQHPEHINDFFQEASVQTPRRIVVSIKALPLEDRVRERGLNGTFVAFKVLKTHDSGTYLLFFYFHDCELNRSETDFLFMEIIAQQVFSFIQITDLLSISQKEREMANQLKVAHSIQTSVLPKGTPALENIKLDAVIQMANEVGGDFYDFHLLPDGRLGLMVADVSGKNVPAALLTMALKVCFKSLVTENLSPRKFLSRMNLALSEFFVESQFITAVFAIFDSQNGRLQLANAGHVPVFIRRKNGTAWKVEKTDFPSFPLGLSDAPPEDYPQLEFHLEESECAFFLTDGVLDLRNERKEFFGEERFCALLEVTPMEKPVQFLFERLEAFRESIPPADDLTMLSLTYLPKLKQKR